MSPFGRAVARAGALAIRGGSDAPDVPPRVSEGQVRRALAGLRDPELGLSILDLGLVYGIAVTGGRVRVTMTLTAAGCPLHEVMPGWVRAAVGAMPGVEEVAVDLSFEPPWTPDRIEVGRS